MTTDLVVVVPGVMGSSLADAAGREVWCLSAGSVSRALLTLGRSLRAPTLPPDVGDGPARDGVTATGLIAGFHVIPGIWSPVTGYGDPGRFLLLPRFGLVPDAPGNLVLFAYDWRLSNRWTAGLLKVRVEAALERWRASAPERRDAQVVFVCHSMGGLVARWYVEREGGAAITRALITLGTPHRGALRTLDELVNGVRKRVGPMKVDLTRFARSLSSSYQLLPEYACIEGAGGLLKTTETPLPALDAARVRDGMRFHEELDAAAAGALSPLVGTVFRAPEIARDEAVTGVAVADLHVAGEPVVVDVRATERRVLAVDEHGREAARELVAFAGETYDAGRHVGRATFERLDPGGYTMAVGAPDDPDAPHVRATTLVWAA